MDIQIMWGFLTGMSVGLIASGFIFSCCNNYSYKKLGFFLIVLGLIVFILKLIFVGWGS